MDDNRAALLRAAQQPPERQAEAVREIAAAKTAPGHIETEAEWRTALLAVRRRAN